MEAKTATGRPAIVNVLREAIRQGLLAPGQPLIQASIADAMGVSRIPVREALHALAAEGIVTFGDDGGARVTTFAPEEVDELWTLRALLESHMAPGIVRNATDEDIDSLAALIREMDDLPPEDWSDRNYFFHQELHRLSGLRHFAEITGRVLVMIDPYSRIAVSVLHEQAEAQLEHHAMIDELRARNAEALGELLLHHSNRARRALLEYATQQQSAGDQQARAAAAARSLADHLSA